MFGLDGGRRMFDRETTKPKKVSETLGRLLPLLQALLAGAAAHRVLIVGNTWTQVITPQLTGQAVDCYLTPATIANPQRRAVGMPGCSGSWETWLPARRATARSTCRSSA